MVEKASSDAKCNVYKVYCSVYKIDIKKWLGSSMSGINYSSNGKARLMIQLTIMLQLLHLTLRTSSAAAMKVALASWMTRVLVGLGS